MKSLSFMTAAALACVMVVPTHAATVQDAAIETALSDVEATLGDAGHRWLTATGPYNGDDAQLEIEITSGGVFDSV